MTAPLLLDADQVRALADPRTLVDALEAALIGGYRPGADPPRSAMPTPHGDVLLMPSTVGAFAGVKVLGLAEYNPARGMPVISGSYLLLDGETLRPVAILDGAAITEVRTAAVSALAVRHLGVTATPRMVVFGRGPQARAHVASLQTLTGASEVVSLSRGDGPDTVTAALAGADLVVCCTSSGTPLFPAAALRGDAVVVAVGAHHPDRREIGSDVVAAATVVVEERATAAHEAGDVALAVADGSLDTADLVELADLVTGRARAPADRPRVFKSVGMAWEDLVVAIELFRRVKADQ